MVPPIDALIMYLIAFQESKHLKIFIAEPERLGLKMSLPMLRSLSTAVLEGKEVLYWTNGFFCAASAKESSSIVFAGTADRNH